MSAARGRQTLRIIAGRWRGRKIHFPDLPELRPTPDRVRETLFNWLMPQLDGARCLDLFAGSGALGLEALSRGAGEVVFVDKERKVTDYLTQTLALLHSEHSKVVQAAALDYLGGTVAPFDIVFLDPPYRAGLQAPCAAALGSRGWLKPGAFIYVEQASDLPPESLPANWVLHRDKTAGQVRYCLYRCA